MAPKLWPPGVTLFDGDDAAYHDWLDRNPAGYVVNVRRTFSAKYVVLHRASCASISASRKAGAYTERGYRKLCSRTDAAVLEAPTCCGRASGRFTSWCGQCKP